jgi:hypothetical protein
MAGRTIELATAETVTHGEYPFSWPARGTDCTNAAASSENRRARITAIRKGTGHMMRPALELNP